MLFGYGRTELMGDFVLFLERSASHTVSGMKGGAQCASKNLFQRGPAD